jgi:hypothetical protein
VPRRHTGEVQLTATPSARSKRPLPEERPLDPGLRGDHTSLGAVSLFTVIATLGAPLEVTAANLAIETFLPADAESAARLHELAAEERQVNGPSPITLRRGSAPGRIAV